MAKVILKAQNLTKKFNERVAVDNTSFSINQGEIFGLIGPNGAGKTTAIKLITGLAKPTEGTVEICGYNLQTDFKKAIDNVGAVIEESRFYPHLSGYNNLTFFASLSKNISKEHINTCIKAVGLEHRIKDKVKTYSQGMKQRLGIAQALLNSPKLLILDEPINGLDPYGISEMRELFKKLAKEKNIAILITSHILSEMEKLCDTIAIINKGKIIENKKIRDFESLLNQTERILIKVDYPNYAAKLIKDTFNLEVQVISNNVILSIQEQTIPKIIKCLISKNISVFQTRKEEKSLEKIFMDTIQEGKSKIL